MPGIEWVKALFDVRTPAARDIVSYWVALALMAGTLAVVYLMLRSRRGLALGAIRDHEAAAAGLGVDIYRIKLAVYVATAAITGMIGALIYLQKARISPDAAFSVLDWTAYVIFIVVIGGIGTMEGPVIGADHLLSDAALSCRFRRLVSHSPWRARHARHAVRAKGTLGPRRGALRSDPAPDAAPTGHPRPRGKGSDILRVR